MYRHWHLQLYGVASGAEKPRRSLHQNCKVHVSHVLIWKRHLNVSIVLKKIILNPYTPLVHLKETPPDHQGIPPN